MKDYKKYNVQIMMGKNVVATCESPLKAAVKVKELCPTLSSQAILRRMYENLGMKARMFDGDLKDKSSKFYGMYSVKLVSKFQPLKEMKEIDLVRLYKSSESISKKDAIFKELQSRYEGWLQNQSRLFLEKIPSDYFGIDFEDAYQECLLLLKKTLDWIDFNRVGAKFEDSKFSVSYYWEKQITARYAVWWYKYNTKKKRSVESFNVEFRDSYSDEPSTCTPRDNYNYEDASVSQVLFNNLDRLLSEKERELKEYLMQGLKESKIKTAMKLSDKSLREYKESIGKKMKQVGLA